MATREEESVSSRVWLLVAFPWSSVWLYIHAHPGTTNWTCNWKNSSIILLRKKFFPSLRPLPCIQLSSQSLESALLPRETSPTQKNKHCITLLLLYCRLFKNGKCRHHHMATVTESLERAAVKEDARWFWPVSTTRAYLISDATALSLY